MNPNESVDETLGRKHCHRCKTELPRSRSDRKWCSQACAQAARRARRKAEAV